jgi:sarcosine oxidase subunit gamma
MPDVSAVVLSAAPTRVRPLPPAARLVLRVRGAEDVPPGFAAGFDLSGRINTVTGEARRFAARLGPDEWLLVAADEPADGIAAALGGALAGRSYAAVDVSDRNAALAVEGPDARAVLNGGIPLDLDDAAFPEGAATRTLCGKAEVVLLRIPGASGFRVECWRSFAHYVGDLLADVAREFEGPG